jgi:3-hydroxyacyl-CoA dehydrogenase
MSQKIEKVAVLGAGVMGAQLAGHLANTGIPSYLFDINQELAQKGIETLTKLKPAPLYHPKNTTLITPCNYEDHLEKIKEADWIVEAVAEQLDIKHKVYQKVTPYLKASAIITSNTSGIPLADLTTAFPKPLKERFMVTHFFNPPRYLHLLELIRSEYTADEVYSTMAEFGENVLGKGIVHAKDTTNFIGNRIGTYGIMITIKLALEMGLTVEEADKLTGTIVGRPKSATFRTADIVGLDTIAHVANGSYDRSKEDEERDIFKIPEILQLLIDDGRLGQKSKAGFYRKDGKIIYSVDLKTGEYGPMKKVLFDGFRLAKEHKITGEKIAAMAYSDDKAGHFFWEILARTLIYAANRIPEISDDILNIDNAMKWGFAWEMGPFETWDAIGVRRSVNRMIDDGKSIPQWVMDMVSSGQENFYSLKNGEKRFFNVNSKEVDIVPSNDRNINLKMEKSKGKLIKRDWSASLIDLGDEILNVEFHSILQPFLNPIDGSIIQIITEGMDLLDNGDFKAMVIGHQGQNFCAGANIAGILKYCDNNDWEGLESILKLFQNLSQRIRFSKAPVVVAPFHLTLGGGFELCAPAAHRVAAAELYIGAVEVGVGVIPGWGGNLRLILNLMENSGKKSRINMFQIVQKAFETIGFGKVATSADEAKSLGYLLKTDTVVINMDHQIRTAKLKALELSDTYNPPKYRDDLKLPGAGGRTAMATAIKGFKLQGKISDHDEKIGKKLAYVLTGGDRGGLTRSVDEQYLLDIERETFISLAAEPLSQDRMRFMLKKGKPLRN